MSRHDVRNHGVTCTCQHGLVFCSAATLAEFALPGEDAESAAARLRAEALSTEHQTWHGVKNPYCKICNEVTVQQQPARRRDPAIVEQVEFEENGTCAYCRGALITIKGWRPGEPPTLQDK